MAATHDDGARAAPRPRPGGVRRGAAPPATWSGRGWSCSTATGAASSARSTWCCATAGAGRLRGEDPLVDAPSGSPSRRSPSARPPGCGGSRRGGWPSTACAPTRCGSTWSACSCRPAGGRRLDHVRGVGWMGFATARTISLDGATGHLIDVQVDLAQGWSTTALVGRPDASINEARDRCRAAVTNSGFDWPTTRRVTILLSPADLPKRGPHFDLAIAVGGARRRRRGARRRALEGVVLRRRADPRRPAARGARACCR